MDKTEAKARVVATLTTTIGVKSKFYLKDFYKILPEMNKRDVNMLVNEMVKEGTLEYWSSGSTTMIGLKGAGKQHLEEE
jgi:hypothetical protein